MRKRAMNWDVFERKYRPVNDPIEGARGTDTLLPFDELPNVDRNRVWTMVDGDTGEHMYLCPGIRVVNQLYFVITEVPWTQHEISDGLSVKYL